MIRATVATLAIVFASTFGFVSTVSASSTPTAQWTAVTGYPLAVAGMGWKPNDRMTFTLSQSGNVYGVEFRATAAGAFKIGIKNFVCSFGGVGHASDFAGVQAMPPVIDPCGPGGKPATPIFVVLKGTAVTPEITYVTGLGAGKPVTIGLSDALYLWEKGSKSPEVMPTAPTKYFALIGQGQAPNPLCAAAKCPAGFYWEWVGTHRGHTAITLRPWCNGHVCPQDWVASLKVDIIAPTA